MESRDGKSHFVATRFRLDNDRAQVVQTAALWVAWAGRCQGFTGEFWYVTAYLPVVRPHSFEHGQ